MVCFCCFFKQKTAYEMRISDWSSDVCSSDLQFFKLHHARLDTEPYAGKFPRIWVGASGPRMLDIAGRYADGWWPAGAWTPEDFAAKLGALRPSDERAGRDPLAIVPRSAEHTSELPSLMRISYAVFCLKKNKNNITHQQPKLSYYA